MARRTHCCSYRAGQSGRPNEFRRELEAEMKLPANRIIEAALHTLKTSWNAVSRHKSGHLSSLKLANDYLHLEAVFRLS